MLIKTIESSISLKTITDIHQASMPVSEEINDLIKEIGTHGGMSVGDTLSMNIELIYTHDPIHNNKRTMMYVIPINTEDAVHEANLANQRDPSFWKQLEKGLDMHYTTNQHMVLFFTKLLGLIETVYDENDQPTHGEISLTTTATYKNLEGSIRLLNHSSNYLVQMIDPTIIINGVYSRNVLAKCHTIDEAIVYLDQLDITERVKPAHHAFAKESIPYEWFHIRHAGIRYIIIPYPEKDV